MCILSFYTLPKYYKLRLFIKKFNILNFYQKNISTYKNLETLIWTRRMFMKSIFKEDKKIWRFRTMSLWAINEINLGNLDVVIGATNWNIEKKKFYFSNFKNIYGNKTNNIWLPFFLPSFYLKKLFKVYYIAKFNTKIITLMLQLPQFWIKNNIFIKMLPICVDKQFENIFNPWIKKKIDYTWRLEPLFFVYYNFLMLYLALIYKNINLFNSTLSKIITMIPYRSQRWIISTIFDFLRFCVKQLISTRNILGLKIVFKGKLDRTGSVRKKKITLRIGKCSINTCDIILLSKHNRIFTITGASGITTYICYIKLNVNYW